MPNVTVASVEYKRLKKETSRLASMANKRLARLESNNLTMMPSYMSWQANGAIRFSVKGKTYNQLQSEYWRVKHFLDERTSTVRQANAFLKEMADNIGLHYGSLEELKNASAMFFELASKIEQYNRTIDSSVRAMDYQRIWSEIHNYIRDDDISLADATDSNELLQGYIDYMNNLVPVEGGTQEGFSLDGTHFEFVTI